MASNPVAFKGTRKGLNIHILPEAAWPEVFSAVEHKLTSQKPFFEGTAVNLYFTGKALGVEQQQTLTRLAEQYMLTGSVEFEPDADKPAASEASDSKAFFLGIEEGMARFVRGTVRSGQRIVSEGNVVVVGDVNPGGEIIAAGNILIMGTLRGLAHAGADGNEAAVVAAYSLQPTQLRIAGIITRAPEGDSTRPEYPEIAYIKNNTLVIEPYLKGRGI